MLFNRHRLVMLLSEGPPYLAQEEDRCKGNEINRQDMCSRCVFPRDVKMKQSERNCSRRSDPGDVENALKVSIEIPE
jgi:hypothetical protein